MKYSNLYEALIGSAERSGLQEGFRFLKDDGTEKDFLSFKDILKKVQSVAWSLNQLGVRKGDFCGLILPEQDNFIIYFYALSWLGAVPVPLSVPFQTDKIGYYINNLKQITKIANIRHYFVTEKLKPFLGEILSAGAEKILSPTEIQAGDEWIDPAYTKDDDIAFLQFTSGSTSQPKGVIVSNENIISNAKCIVEDNIILNADDRMFSWLPFYHDMGLIGFVITPIIYQCSGEYLSPLAFIKRPALWLQMMSKYKSTVSFAPNFAYSLCAKRIQDDAVKNLDLSHWRMAGCGAEPILSKTVKDFITRFEPCGFKAKSFKACYGLAESTLAVAFPDQKDEPKFDLIDEGVMRVEHIAQKAERQEGCLELISCGHSFPNHEISVRDEYFEECQERVIGEIAIKGPSVSRGYLNNPEATAAAFKNGWLLTGDLGYIADGELYVCGRKKELIIIAGRNYYPTDIEAVVSDIQGIRRGNVIAFAVSDHSGEKLVICAETRINTVEQLNNLKQEIKDQVNQSINIIPADVILLQPGALPKTSSGKLQRSKVKGLYELGTLTLLKSFRNFQPFVIAVRLGMIWLKSKAGYLISGIRKGE